MARPKSTDEQRTNRNIRMTDFEWSVFRDHMGADWLRNTIAKVAKAKKIKPTEKGE